MATTSSKKIKIDKTSPKKQKQSLYKLANRLGRDLNDAYMERNRLVQLLTYMFPSHIANQKERANSPVVYIETPTGQISFHYQPNCAFLFTHLEVREENSFDGHTTDLKWKRVEDLCKTFLK